MTSLLRTVQFRPQALRCNRASAIPLPDCRVAQRQNRGCCQLTRVHRICHMHRRQPRWELAPDAHQDPAPLRQAPWRGQSFRQAPFRVPLQRLDPASWRVPVRHMG